MLPPLVLQHIPLFNGFGFLFVFSYPQAQHRDTFIEERYGKYNISDPLMALQRDFETLKEKNDSEKQPVCTNPLSILKAVMKQCKNMQERMLSQLAAAESRHRKVGLPIGRHVLQKSSEDSGQPPVFMGIGGAGELVSIIKTLRLHRSQGTKRNRSLHRSRHY